MFEIFDGFGTKFWGKSVAWRVFLTSSTASGWHFEAPKASKSMSSGFLYPCRKFQPIPKDRVWAISIPPQTSFWPTLVMWPNMLRGTVKKLHTKKPKNRSIWARTLGGRAPAPPGASFTCLTNRRYNREFRLNLHTFLISIYLNQWFFRLNMTFGWQVTKSSTFGQFFFNLGPLAGNRQYDT